jgi:hypothetical protein
VALTLNPEDAACPLPTEDQLVLRIANLVRAVDVQQRQWSSECESLIERNEALTHSLVVATSMARHAVECLRLAKPYDGKVQAVADTVDRALDKMEAAL